MDKYGLFGNLTAKDGKGDDLAAILLEAATLMSSTKGCHAYWVSKDLVNGDVVWVTEVWATKADHDASLQGESVRALIARAMPLLAENPATGLELAVVGGYGI
jgi:quinol monooxygenase YgiN